MAYEKKPESGALFRNDKKEKDSHPDYKGDALIDGKLYWVSSWVNESKGGKKYMSLAFKLKDEQAAPKPDAPAQSSGAVDDEFNDACPF